MLLTLLKVALLAQAIESVGAFSSRPTFAIPHRCIRTTTTTTTKLHESPQVFSKKRARVVLDPKTGFYRPEPKSFTDKLPASKENPWDSLKSIVYGTVDGVRSIPQKLQRAEEVKGVVDGYEQVQKRVYQAGSSSPAERLLREYEKRGTSPSQEETVAGTFDILKGAVYGSFDAINSLATKKEVQPEQIESFKPVVRSSLGASEEVQTSLSDLTSSNPVRKILAQNKIREFERNEREMQEAIERHKKTRAVKEFFYRVGDAAKWAAEGLVQLPKRLTDVYEETSEFVASVPDTVGRATDAAVAIPDKVQEKVEEVRKTVDDIIATTKRVVENVQAIPGKVVETAEKVKKTAKETGKTVTAAVEVVDDTVTRGKVLLGLEKPKPRPPNTPPPKPISASEIGWKVAEGVASVGTKLAWWAGKGVAFFAFQGAKLAFEKGAEALKEQQNGTDISAMSVSLASTPSTKTVKPSTLAKKSAEKKTPKTPLPPLEPPPSVKAKKEEKKPKDEPIEVELNLDMDLQVTEALRLAEDALKVSEDSLKVADAEPANKE